MIKILLSVAVVLAALPAGAGETRPSVLDAIGLSGSRSLAVYALSNPALPDVMHRERRAIESGMGLAGRKGSGWIRFAPVLTWDGNVNGGSVGDAVSIGGFDFRIAEEYRAVSGVLTGVSMDAGRRIPIAERTALEFDLDAMAAWAPRHDMAKTGLRASICVRHMLEGRAVHVQGCVDGQHQSYDLGETRRAGADVTVSRAFASTSAFHEVAGTVREERTFGEDGGDQTIVSARYTGAFGNGLSVSLQAGIGSETESRISMRERLMVSAAKNVHDRPTWLMAGIQRNRGGMFLGETREEQAVFFGAGRQVGDRISVGGSVTRTDAKHDFFDSTSLGLDIGFSF